MDSYLEAAACKTDAASEFASCHNETKYAALDVHRIFQLITVETLGVLSKLVIQAIRSLAVRISEHSGEDRVTFSVLETVSFDAAFQCCLLHDSLPHPDCVDW